AVNNAARRKVGGWNQLDQLIDRAFGVPQAIQTTVNDLGQVVRRNIGGHAHGNTRTAVDQQIGQARRQYQRLLFAAIVVGAKINRFLVEVGQQLVGNAGQADFGIAHGRR